MKEGLSIALDTHRIPTGLVENSLSHMIDAPDEVRIEERGNNLHILIPKGVVVSIPITITTSYNTAGSCHITIISEMGSKATINRYILERKSREEKGIITENTDIKVEGDLSYNQAQALSSTTSFLNTKNAQSQGTLRIFDYVLGGEIIQVSNNITVDENSTARHFCAAHLTGTQQADMNTIIRHQGVKSKSDIQSKAVIMGEAKLLQRGLTIIEQQAQESEGFQHFNILIDEQAVADALPKLEINNPEVICSHGASIGSVDEEQMHYLRSRGFSKKEAQNLITNSFLSGIITQAKDTAWQADMLSLLTAAQQDLQCMRCKHIKNCRCES